mmetsp:Transcript_42054/g.133624  ORF Transcript_42054/g.133624 Transcript_42054/m.133624 type:complete len:149 (-) Transcript_42054:33-479(-)
MNASLNVLLLGAMWSAASADRDTSKHGDLHLQASEVRKSALAHHADVQAKLGGDPKIVDEDGRKVVTQCDNLEFDTFDLYQQNSCCCGHGPYAGMNGCYWQAREHKKGMSARQSMTQILAELKCRICQQVVETYNTAPWDADTCPGFY